MSVVRSVASTCPDSPKRVLGCGPCCCEMIFLSLSCALWRAFTDAFAVLLTVVQGMVAHVCRRQKRGQTFLHCRSTYSSYCRELGEARADPYGQLDGRHSV